MRFRRRVAAKLIDTAIIAAVAVLFVTLWSSHLAQMPGRLAATVLWSGMIFQIAFVAVCLNRWGATPGKMLCRLKVVATPGRSVGQIRAFARSVVNSLGLATLVIGYSGPGLDGSGPQQSLALFNVVMWALFLSYFVALLDKPAQRTMSDRICGTRVLYG